jgi:hypothetical protein
VCDAVLQLEMAAVIDRAKPEAPTAAKLTRWEAMWTDCDPEQWEYVVV